MAMLPVLRDLIALTQPRILSALLALAVASMFLTPRGRPPPTMVGWVLLAGYAMAGGANTLRMWRTRLVPAPAGPIPPGGALLLGITLAASGFALFWSQVNPLAAWLALTGVLLGILVYPLGLERASPLSVGIGGAAVAAPALVGWAAVTGSIDLAATCLFAIVFYWIPPRIWAQALVQQTAGGVLGESRAGDEHRTKVRILIYAMLLLPLTLLPAANGTQGLAYAAAATLLGTRLLWYCVRLVQANPANPAALRLYRYSRLYLAMLFIAMGADKVIPFGHRPPPPEVLRLVKPHSTPNP